MFGASVFKIVQIRVPKAPVIRVRLLLLVLPLKSVTSRPWWTVLTWRTHELTHSRDRGHCCACDPRALAIDQHSAGHRQEWTRGVAAADAALDLLPRRSRAQRCHTSSVGNHFGFGGGEYGRGHQVHPLRELHPDRECAGEHI